MTFSNHPKAYDFEGKRLAEFGGLAANRALASYIKRKFATSFLPSPVSTLSGWN